MGTRVDRGGGVKIWGVSFKFVPVVQVSLREIGLRKRKQINVCQRLQTSKATGPE